MLVLRIGLCLGCPPEADLLPQLLQGGQVDDGLGVAIVPVLGAQDDDETSLLLELELLAQLRVQGRVEADTPKDQDASDFEDVKCDEFLSGGAMLLEPC